MSAPCCSARIAALTPKTVLEVPEEAPQKQDSEGKKVKPARSTFQPKLMFHDDVAILNEISLNHKEKLRTCADVRASYHDALIRCAWSLGYIHSRVGSLLTEIDAAEQRDLDTTRQVQKLKEILGPCAESASTLLDVLDETGDDALLHCYLPASVESRWVSLDACEHERKVRKYIKDLFDF